MKALLLPVLLLSLVAALQAQDDPLSLLLQENITGTWYTKAIVTGKHGPERKNLEKAFPTTVTALEDGNLEVKTSLLIKGRCHEIKFVMYKTETPGKYSALNGRKTVYVEELPVKDHSIIYCEDQGKGFGMGKLVGKSPEENPEALEEFRKFVQRKGLLEEHISVPEKTESCTPQ